MDLSQGFQPGLLGFLEMGSWPTRVDTGTPGSEQSGWHCASSLMYPKCSSSLAGVPEMWGGGFEQNKHPSQPAGGLQESRTSSYFQGQRNTPFRPAGNGKTWDHFSVRKLAVNLDSRPTPAMDSVHQRGTRLIQGTGRSHMGLHKAETPREKEQPSPITPPCPLQTAGGGAPESSPRGSHSALTRLSNQTTPRAPGRWEPASFNSASSPGWAVSPEAKIHLEPCPP